MPMDFAYDSTLNLLTLLFFLYILNPPPFFMYLILIEINNDYILLIILSPAHILSSSTSFRDTMHLVGNTSSMQHTQLWSVGKSTFLHDVYL